MKTAWTTALLLLGAAAPSFAQHPCDTTSSTLFREPSAQLSKLKVGFCFAPLDSSGVPFIEPVGFAMQIDGGADIDLGIVAPIGTPNAAGLNYYEVTSTRLTAGVVTMKAYTATFGMSAASPPITLTLLGPPQAPSNLRITRISGQGGPEP